MHYLSLNAQRAHPKRDQRSGRLKLGLQHVYAQGRFGKALSFDGLNDWVTVNDAASLDLTTGMTVVAWSILPSR